jgi:undecaprenyl phosphate N,N'-diacetylbacillosamine 1-phosphate transferase
MTVYRTFIKRFIDWAVAIVLLVLTLPVWLVCYLYLFFANKGKVFFTQERPGKNTSPFRVLKFKTMNDKRDSHGKLLPDKERLTTAGRFIRTTSLDELPQLINVLKGDMSLIGPRPLLPKYLPLYNHQQKRRHEVRPGITGWAQVNGRNAITWTKKFEYDVWYVDNVSFLLDCKIVGLTIVKIFKREGITAQGSATTVAFNGNN